MYKDTTILNFKECYSSEKVHGTSTHIAWKDNKIRFFAGGEKHEKFIKLFNEEKLTKLFTDKFQDTNIVIYGEAIGGKQQGMSHTYGKELLFVAFDVKIDGNWLDMPNAEQIVKDFGLEFIHYVKIPATIEAINSERDKPSIQAKRVGIEEDKLREGVVLRPLIELTKNNGNRIICKHKRDEFMETRTPREVDPEKLRILAEAKEIANEWCTPMRLEHVLDKLGNPDDISDTGKVIKAMIEDVFREASGEIVESRTAQQAIGKASAILYKAKINKLQNVH